MDWDGTSRAHLTRVTYRCANGMSQSYAWCADDGTWHYSAMRAATDDVPAR